MQKKFKGILIFVKIYKENDLYIKFLSDTDELVSGIVYGGLSKKKRNIYQIGFYLNFEVSFKLNKPSSISAELSEPYMANIIEDKYKINCVLSVTSLLNLSIIEGQKIKNIFYETDKFLSFMFLNKNWLKNYFTYLFNLLKIIGYEINFKNKNDKQYFDLDNLEFTNSQNNTSVNLKDIFLENNNFKIDKKSIIKIFNIFELVFNKYHLSNFNLILPNQYYLFKKLIINRINK